MPASKDHNIVIRDDTFPMVNSSKLSSTVFIRVDIVIIGLTWNRVFKQTDFQIFTVL